MKRLKAIDIRLNAVQKRFINVLVDEFGITSFEMIGAEGQLALLYMGEVIRSFDILEPLVNDFLKLIDLEEQAEQL
jgi:hypothetical protein